MDKKKKVYKDYANGMTYKAISEKHDIPISTLKSWRNKEKWQRIPKNDAPRKRGGQPNNVNAVGNKGGSSPAGNRRAEKYGFYSKYLPPDMLEIMMDIQDKSMLDIQEEQIELQFASILRAQKIMYVEHEEMVKTIVSEGYGTSYDVQYAWDRYDRYITAQSRAMGTLNNMIKQYEEMLRNAEEAEDIKAERQARIAKIKAETQRIKDEQKASEGKPVVFTGEGDLSD